MTDYWTDTDREWAELEADLNALAQAFLQATS